MSYVLRSKDMTLTIVYGRECQMSLFFLECVSHPTYHRCNSFAGKDTHAFSAGHHHYTLHFKEWRQQNNVHKTKRPVRRRPAEFVSKENMKDIVQR